MANALTRTVAPLMQRMRSWLPGEGSWRGPFSGQGHLGNWYELGRLEDGYQRDLRVDRYGMQYIPVIAGLRHLHRSAFAQLRPHHMRENEKGVITDLRNSAQLRVMMQPNDYETGADFAARLAELWMTMGEVLVWGIRNERFEIAQMHIVPRDAWRLAIDPETQTIFYVVQRSTNDLLGETKPEFILPHRDVLHLRWATPRHPLIGESGFAAAGLAAGINVALSNSQAMFFAQMRRPSGVLSTDMQLTKEQILRLREAYDAQAKGMAQGGVPILASGLKWQAMAISSEDAEVIAALRMSNEEIARCVGVPGPLIGDLEKSGLTNTEALIEFWLSLSLGGLIERYESGLNRLLGLDGRTDWVDMSTEALLRTNLVQRMEGLTKGVQGGVLSPNEARKREGLSPVDGGDQVFMQRQNTPVDLLSELAANELKTDEQNSTPPQLPAPALNEEQDDETAKSLALMELAAANQRAQVAEALLAINERAASLKDGRDGTDAKDGVDGIGIRAITQAADLWSFEIELSNGERQKICLPTQDDGPAGVSAELRAQVAEALLAINQRAASLKDGRDGTDGKQGVDGVDGIGIRSLAQAEDLCSVEFEFTNDERHVITLPSGERGEKGDAGIGLDAPAWQVGVHREGVVVQHYEGRIYRALQDTPDEPGDSPHWQRLGLHGQRWCGPFDATRQYETGDLYVDGGTFVVLSSGVRRCLAAKPLSPSEVRAIVGKQLEEGRATFRKIQDAAQAEIAKLTESIVALASDQQKFSQIVGAISDTLGSSNRRTNELTLEMQDLRVVVEDLQKKGGRTR
jgi:HK97 family phage portal protein